MRFLGIDYGKNRVGLALSDESGRLAFPHAVLPNDKALIANVAEIAKEQKVKAVVVGESKDLSGKSNPLMKDIDAFIASLKKAAKKPIVLEPEFWTSFQAARWQGKTAKLDASAAAIILQSYLDKRNA